MDTQGRLRKYDNTPLAACDAQGTPRATFLDEISASVAVAGKELVELVTKSRELADGVFGSQPEGTGHEDKTARGSGRASQIREQLEWMHETITTLRVQIYRLNAL